MNPSDIRHAFRTLWKSRTFSAVVILTCALGIGASTSVFCAIERLLLRPLPYPDSDRLVALHETQTGKGFRPVSLPNLLDWRAQSSSFDGVAGYMRRSFGLRGGRGEDGSPIHVIQTGMVTSDFFHVLGKSPVLGRSFTEQEERQGTSVILLTDTLWARQFQRAGNIIGRVVLLNEAPYTVIGVLPPDFVFPSLAEQVDACIPMNHVDYASRDVRPLQAIAHLKPGVSRESARAEFQAIGKRLAEAWPQDNLRGGADLESLNESWKGSLRRPLLLLMGAALLLLAIVCTNVGNLMLARALARSRETAVRCALGAGFAHLCRQALAEALVLSLAGGLLGLLLALGCLRLLPLALDLPGTSGLALNAPVLGFAFLLCLLTGLACGLAPVLLTRAASVNELLKEGGAAGPSRSGWPFRVRRGLVTAQVALSLVLLMSAGLFLRVFLKLASRHPGFESSQVYYFGYGLPETRYDDRAMIEFHRRLRAKLAEIPEVQAAGAVWRLPLNGRNLTTCFQFEGAGLPKTEWPWVARNFVDPGYFTALRIPLLAGRNFSWESDLPDRPSAIIVNSTFARMYGGSRSLLGKRVQLRNGDKLWQIVGIVGDTYQMSLDQSIRPQIYQPVSQLGLDGGSFVIRTTRADADLAASVAAAVRSVDPDLERIRLRRLDDWVDDSLGRRRLPALLTALFAAVGLSLTALGLYGIVAFEVGQRRREIAIRAALGASRPNIVVLVLRYGLALVFAGAGLGALVFLATSRLLESQLYEVAPSDPLTAIVVATVLLICAALACLMPARDALRLDPVSVLRDA